MTNPKITDEGVAALPLHEARAELLEEIMALPTTETPSDELTEARDRRRRRWVPVAVAAAAAVAIGLAVAVPAWLHDDQRHVEAPVAAPGDGEIAVLRAPGWELVNADSIDENGGEISYASGDGQNLDIDWRPADLYQSYVDDRSDVGTPRHVTVLGEPALLWAYSRNDHTVIRNVVGDFTLEVRGSGMPERDFLALLDHLLAIDPADLDSYLPDSFVTDAERPGVVADMLDPIPVPDTFDPSTLKSSEVSRYQLGAAVTSAVTCAWLDQFATAKEAGDQAAMQEAVDAMATSRDWPVLAEMDKEGDWPEFIWQFADEIAAGKVPVDYRHAIGCS
ncbi:MAG TPA: hypothetical protein VNS55_12440 [Nocardioides sp.]|nr:hypothetical protein [Nocardioides sp.]